MYLSDFPLRRFETNFLSISTALTWALFSLTQNVTAQARLREELLSVSTDNPTMEELNDDETAEELAEELDEALWETDEDDEGA